MGIWSVRMGGSGRIGRGPIAPWPPPSAMCKGRIYPSSLSNLHYRSSPASSNETQYPYSPTESNTPYS